MIIRAPVVAGQFYSLNEENLRKEIEACIKHEFGPKNIKLEKFFGAIVPHAGYQYSGPIAAWVYSRIEKGNYVIIGTNHSGYGSKFALMKKGTWKTPFGLIRIDEELSEEILESCKLIEFDVLAHQYEHSIEVQLPFLQYRFGNDFKFIPLTILNTFADEEFLKECKLVSEALAKVLKRKKEKWIILGSSDLSHYLPYEELVKVDKYLLKPLLEMKVKKFFERIREKNASFCGYGAIAVTLIASKKLGAKKAKLLKYSNSGDISGDKSVNVGYAAIIFK